MQGKMSHGPSQAGLVALAVPLPFAMRARSSRQASKLQLRANVTNSGTWHFDTLVFAALLAEHPLSKREVAGSNPTGDVRLKHAVFEAH